MKPLFSTFIFVLCTFTISAQDKLIIFPDDFFGIWEGPLNIYQGQTVAQTVVMRAVSLPTDTAGTYVWAIIYGQDTIKGLRDYEMRMVDKSKGHCIIDEKNGIILDSYFMGNKLVSNFTVMENQLLTMYELRGDELIFEVFVNKALPTRTSGNMIDVDGEKIPEVVSYQQIGYQRGVMKKIREK